MSNIRIVFVLNEGMNYWGKNKYKYLPDLFCWYKIKWRTSTLLPDFQNRSQIPSIKLLRPWHSAPRLLLITVSPPSPIQDWRDCHTVSGSSWKVLLEIVMNSKSILRMLRTSWTGRRKLNNKSKFHLNQHVLSSKILREFLPLSILHQWEMQLQEWEVIPRKLTLCALLI